MLMSFSWLTDDLLKDKSSKFCGPNLLVLRKVREPEKPGNSSSMRRQKSPLLRWTICQIYYKKSGKSRKVVAINSDYDIPSLLAEYPMMTLGSGRRSRKPIMIMAVDLSEPAGSVQTAPRTPKQNHGK